jgi:hypothetical protein
VFGAWFGLFGLFLAFGCFGLVKYNGFLRRLRYYASVAHHRQRFLYTLSLSLSPGSSFGHSNSLSHRVIPASSSSTFTFTPATSPESFFLSVWSLYCHRLRMPPASRCFYIPCLDAHCFDAVSTSYLVSCPRITLPWPSRLRFRSTSRSITVSHRLAPCLALPTWSFIGARSWRGRYCHEWQVKALVPVATDFL